VVFTHDDLCMSTGPVFPPDFYERYIFSRYERIWEPLVSRGKKLVFVTDGNIELFLDRLLRLPIAGIMFETPATPFDRVLTTWGKAGRGFIGGISTSILTNGTPQEVRQHTRQVIEQGRRYPGFMLSSCGGLHGNIPMANLRAYFETRDRMGIPADL
jgi:uroporphyrinogen-III decarboxylase